jgi:hypothetical protein
LIFGWIGGGYGTLQEVQTAIMAMILSIVGLQTIFSAVFISLLLLNSGDASDHELRLP